MCLAANYVMGTIAASREQNLAYKVTTLRLRDHAPRPTYVQHIGTSVEHHLTPPYSGAGRCFL